MLLYLISFYFDRLKYFCESKPDRDKKWQKAIVVPYLDATMIVDFPKSIQVSSGENPPYDFGRFGPEGFTGRIFKVNEYI